MQTIGIVDVIWRGQRLAVEKGVKFTPPGYKNTAVPFGRGVARSQEFEAGMVEITTMLPKGTRYDDLVGDMGEAELVLVTDINNIFSFPQAFLTERPQLGDDGKSSFKWSVGQYEEVIA